MFLTQREYNVVYYLLLSVSPFFCLFHCPSVSLFLSSFLSLSISLFPFLSLSLSLFFSPFFLKHRTEIDDGLCDRCPSVRPSSGSAYPGHSQGLCCRYAHVVDVFPHWPLFPGLLAPRL